MKSFHSGPEVNLSPKDLLGSASTPGRLASGEMACMASATGRFEVSLSGLFLVMFPVACGKNRFSMFTLPGERKVERITAIGILLLQVTNGAQADNLSVNGERVL